MECLRRWPTRKKKGVGQLIDAMFLRRGFIDAFHVVLPSAVVELDDLGAIQGQISLKGLAKMTATVEAREFKIQANLPAFCKTTTSRGHPLDLSSLENLLLLH